jgi:hypothetical protein
MTTTLWSENRGHDYNSPQHTRILLANMFDTRFENGRNSKWPFLQVQDLFEWNTKGYMYAPQAVNLIARTTQAYSTMPSYS